MNLITYMRLRVLGNDKGQDLVEYALLVALVALAAAGALEIANGGITRAFEGISSSLDSAMSGS
jgi:Flp pilus assembly pilin Flp